jgi:hypothetical protein
MTHTYATLEVTRSTFHEIERRLAKVNYQHAFQLDKNDEVILIDMHGIALTMEDDGEEKPNDRSGAS